MIAALRSEGPFTPISLQGTIQTPSNSGGFNWGGLSYDPERQMLVGAVNRFAAVMQLIPREEATVAEETGERFGLETAAAARHALHAGAQSTPRPGDSAPVTARRRGAPWRPSTSRMARWPGRYRWAW